MEVTSPNTRKRRWVQVAALLFLRASWGPELKWLCLPVLSCHSCAVSWFACPIGVLVHFSGFHLFPLFALGTVLLLGTLFGRSLCGWVCPFGFFQDMMHNIPSRKVSLPPWTGYLKYTVLAAIVIILPSFLGENTWFSFCRICPASALQVSTPNLIQEGMSIWSTSMAVKFAVLFGVLGLVVVSNRAFCKTMCPVGALLGPLNHLAFWAVKRPAETCPVCGRCDAVCPMEAEAAPYRAPSRAAPVTAA